MRAEPNTVTARGTSASAPKPSTNSLWIRSTRQGSVCTQSVAPLVEQPLVGGLVSLRARLVFADSELAPRYFEPEYRVSGCAIATEASGCAIRIVGHRVTVTQPRRYRADVRHVGDLRGGHVLVPLVGEVRVAGAEVHRRDAERREPGDVGPPVLGAEPPPAASIRAAAAGCANPGSAPGGSVGDLEVTPVDPGEDLPDVRRSPARRCGRGRSGSSRPARPRRAPRCRDAAGDPHGGQALAVDAAVDVDRARPCSRPAAAAPGASGGSRCRPATIAPSARGCRGWSAAPAACPGSRPRSGRRSARRESRRRRAATRAVRVRSVRARCGLAAISSQS